MSKSVKLTKSFSELVNIKIEPILQSDWIFKVSSKGKLQKRFFVATYAAIYICKTTGLWQKLKFKHVYPWVDLKRISSTLPNLLLFHFDSKTIKIQIEEARAWISPTVAFLEQLFPDNHKVQIDIQQSQEQLNYSADPQPTQFIDLFISSCISLDVRPDPHWCSIIRKELRNDGDLDLLDVEYNPKIIAALCRALSLMRTVPRVIIGGFKFLSVYGSLSSIIESNPTIEELSIIDTLTTDGFQLFCNHIEHSGLEVLRFNNVKLTDDMVRMMASIKFSDHIHVLELKRCNLSDDALAELFTHSSAFRGLEIFKLAKDKRKLSDSNLKRLFKFVSDASVPKFVLKNMQIDVVSVLKCFVNEKYDINSLDLSDNFCNPLPQIDLSFPASLTNLSLRGVKWHGNSMAQFLSLQPFRGTVKVDFSYAKFPDVSPMDPFGQLADKPQTNYLESINWKHNPISSKFIRFLSNFSFLHEAVLDSCPILPSDETSIILALSDFIRGSKLTKLSLSSTLRSFKEAGIKGLAPALAQHQYIRSFNYSNNSIGDRGLMILRDILLNNETITRLNFSGANLFDPNNFLEFLRSISQLTTLSHVTKPKRDISFLLTRSSKSMENEINELWANLSERTAKNAEMHHLEMTQSMNSGFLSTIDSSSIFEASQVTYIEASWDLTIDINYPNPSKEWEKLAKQFSFENITGFPKPSIQDMSNTDSYNLIEFDQL